MEKNVDFSWSPKWDKRHVAKCKLVYMDHFMDDNGDGFSDEVLSERISVFNKWAFHRKSGRIFDFSAKYYFEDRFGGIENWT